MFRNYIKIAYRNLIKHKTLTIINILGLSMGLTCAILTFLFIEYELSFDKHHANAEKIYRVVEEARYANRTYHWSTTAFPLADALRSDFSEFEFVAQAGGITNTIISVDDGLGNKIKFKEDQVLYADPDYLKVFDNEWLSGNPETALNEASSIILTSATATKYFGELSPHDAIGKTLLFDGKDPLIITGIIADLPTNSTLLFSVLVPFELFKLKDPYSANNWSGNYNGTTFVVVPTNLASHEIEKKIASWKSKYLSAEDDDRISYFLQPLTDIHTDEKYVSSPGSYVMPKKYLAGAFTTGIFILLLACVNFVNLATAHASNRVKEVGVRKTMGGKRSQLISQFLIENAMLTSLAIVLSLTTTQFLVLELNELLSDINLTLTLHLEHLVLITCFGFFIAVVAGIYPAYVMSAYKPAFAFQNTKNTKNTLLLRRILVVFQFTVVQAMIISTLVVASQMSYVLEKDLGYEENAVLTVPIPDISKIEIFRQELTSNPDIVDVAFGSGPPTSTNRSYGTNTRLPHQSKGEGISTEMKAIGKNYINFYELEIIAGRNFTYVSDDSVQYIVNEKLAKSLGWGPEEAIGQKIAINEGEATIIGVLKDFHNNTLQDDITPCILLNWNLFYDVANIRYNADQSNVTQTIDFISDKWGVIFPESVFEYTFLEDFLEKDYKQEHLIFSGFKVFSFIAIFIGCLGLFGMIQFVALKRTKEIGIRKILGATTLNLASILSSELLRLVVLAFIIACPIGYYFMSDWLLGFAYHIDLSWQIFVFAGLGALAITSLTVSYQTFKTANANPVEALRYE